MGKRRKGKSTETGFVLSLLALWFTASPAWAQFGGGRAGGLGVGGPITVSAQFTTAKDGKPAELFITAKLDPGWHIYSITQPAGGPMKSEIKLAKSNAWKQAGSFRPQPEPEVGIEEAFPGVSIETHTGKVVWRAPIEFAPGVDPRSVKIEGRLNVQLCDAGTCSPQDIAFTAGLGTGREVSGVAMPASSPSFDEAKLQEYIAKQEEGISLWVQLALGFVGGIILNLMPCVLPVIGLKILSFVEQAGHDRKTAFVLNVWYSVGLLAVWWLMAALTVGLSVGSGQFFQNPAFNVFIAALVFTMALAFLGVWEFPVPGFVGRGQAVELAQREGATGALFKGAITTILATPCLGPFMGVALGWAVRQPPATTFAVFTSVGLGMASPYLLIGAFPVLIRFLPKPGAWMETFKHLMGFVLLGTVVFVLSFLTPSYVVPTVGLLFALWMACWWLARTPPTAEFRAKFRAWMEGTAIVGLAWLVLFFIKFGHPLPWQPFTSRASLDRMVTEGNTVLVDFTANWCASCKTFEAWYLNTKAVLNLVEQNKVITLKADWTQNDPEVTAMLGLLGASGVPVVAIFPAGRPTEPIRFIGVYTQGKVLDALEKAGPSRPVPSTREGARSGSP
jgi:thiol:disulfide interchange protein DsbD